MQRIEELFHSALAAGPARRAEFLAESCEAEEDLRREVESLLKAHDLGKSFIERPAADVAADLLAGGRGRLEAGRRLGRYQIKRLLGEGGMGEVYLAEDVRLGRPVALKLLAAPLTAGDDRLRRFEREARAASALNHPGIVTVHDVGEENGLHFIATEYIDGQTLREHMAGARMAIGQALDIAAQTASALQAAHAAGIVHRDVKPENIMLRRDRILKVLDFGLAKLNSQHTAAGGVLPAHSMTGTHPGVIMGTVAYMSPEQARGLDVDARTDVWSLGIVLYEMLAGCLPFYGATPTDTIIAIAEREPAPLASLVQDAPVSLERIVKKALAKDRGERYPSAEELLADLKTLSRDLETDGAAMYSARAATGRETSAAGGRDGVTANQPPPPGHRTPAPLIEVRSLAVLPLENLSGDASQDYFADGMTEALITDLAKIGALKVISRLSAMRYKGTRRLLPEVGRELNVDALLTGSVVRSGGRVRVAVQLIRAATEQHLWADSYERDLSDVLSLQREVTRDIVGEIRIKLTPQERSHFGSVPPVHPEAYDHYLRGQFYLHRQNREDNETAVAALERAAATDPTFAAAYAGLAQAYVWKLFLFAPGEGRWAEKAFVAAEKALALDPNSAVAHLARGRLLWTPANRFPHERAIREYRRALALNPGLDEARNQLALVYNHVGAFEEALRELETAVAINPSNAPARFRVGETLLFQGKYEQALTALRGVPKEANPALVGHQTAWALFNLGRSREASAELEQLLREHPEDSGGLFTGVQAVLAASAGQERRAEEKINSAIERGKGFGHFHHTAYHIACAYALMNKPGRATEWLEDAAGDGFPCYPLFERDANLDNLRGDARFNAFMGELKRQWEYYMTIV